MILFKVFFIGGINMKKNMLSKLSTSKKIVICTALVATLGAGTALAANSFQSLELKMDDGVISYSTDEGTTWNQDIPEGVTVDQEDGAVIITGDATQDDSTLGTGTALEANSYESLELKMDDGAISYSTDEGMTWSQDIPEGVTVDQENGSITITGASN